MALPPQAIEIYEKHFGKVEDYETLKKATARYGMYFEVDHLLEKRFEIDLAFFSAGAHRDHYPSVIVPKNKAVQSELIHMKLGVFDHLSKTLALRILIPHGTEGFFTPQQIWDAHVKVLQDMRLPHEGIKNLETIFQDVVPKIIFRYQFPDDHFKGKWPNVTVRVSRGTAAQQKKVKPTKQEKGTTASPKKVATVVPKKVLTATPKKTAIVAPKKALTATPKKNAIVAPKKAAKAAPKKPATAAPKPTRTREGPIENIDDKTRATQNKNLLGTNTTKDATKIIDAKARGLTEIRRPVVEASPQFPTRPKSLPKPHTLQDGLRKNLFDKHFSVPLTRAKEALRTRFGKVNFKGIIHSVGGMAAGYLKAYISQKFNEYQMERDFAKHIQSKVDALGNMFLSTANDSNSYINRYYYTDFFKKSYKCLFFQYTFQTAFAITRSFEDRNINETRSYVGMDLLSYKMSPDFKASETVKKTDVQSLGPFVEYYLEYTIMTVSVPLITADYVIKREIEELNPLLQDIKVEYLKSFADPDKNKVIYIEQAINSFNELLQSFPEGRKEDDDPSITYTNNIVFRQNWLTGLNDILQNLGRAINIFVASPSDTWRFSLSRDELSFLENEGAYYKLIITRLEDVRNYLQKNSSLSCN